MFLSRYDAIIAYKRHQMKRVSVRFADKEHELLVNLSEQVERSINDLIREAVRKYMETQGVKTP